MHLFSKKFDKRNFRRRILEMDFLEKSKSSKEYKEEKLFYTNLIQRNIITIPKQGSNHYNF